MKKLIITLVMAFHSHLYAQDFEIVGSVLMSSSSCQFAKEYLQAIEEYRKDKSSKVKQLAVENSRLLAETMGAFSLVTSATVILDTPRVLKVQALQKWLDENDQELPTHQVFAPVMGLVTTPEGVMTFPYAGSAGMLIQLTPFALCPGLPEDASDQLKEKTSEDIVSQMITVIE